jgi:hypothetical protein
MYVCSRIDEQQLGRPFLSALVGIVVKEGIERPSSQLLGKGRPSTDGLYRSSEQVTGQVRSGLKQLPSTIIKKYRKEMILNRIA